MKKLCSILVLCLLTLLALAGCAHTHDYTPSNPSVASCTSASVVRYTCSCGDFYDTEVSPALGHLMTKTEGIAATCDTDGRPEYYTCSRCEKHYTDEAGTTVLAESELVIPAGHRAVHRPLTDPLRFEDGYWEHWECMLCGGLFSDAACLWETTRDAIMIPSPYNMVDFVVEVEAGRDPVVLQLTDPQFVDATQMEEKAFSYLRETIEATKPDLIIITGDLVYGKYETTGESFTAFITFMESFGIPWAPVFGNHDNELPQGVDWQCEQLTAAEHCLFKRGNLTGNGNYTVGVASGDDLVRVFYMMDSNGCAAPSAASEGKVKKSIGFGADQLTWLEEDVNALLEVAPDIKISIAFHIQLSVFGEAMDRYEEYFKIHTDSIYRKYPKAWIDKLEDAQAGDFGIIGYDPDEAIDGDKKVWNLIKTLGIDSVFVGHEHCNSFSIVYEGVRLQYGQKSTSYDSHNWIKDGSIGSGWYDGWVTPEGATALVGGTVIPLAEDGEILKGYIYLCGEIPEYNP